MAPDAAASPGIPPVQVIPGEEFLSSIPGKVHSHIRSKSRRDLEEEAEEFNERQQELREKRNHEVARRFNAFHEAGGWQKIYLSQLAHVRALLPQAAAQLDSQEALLMKWALCTTPDIFSVDSTFRGDPFGPSNFFSVDHPSTVEPQADVLISGCTLGPMGAFGTVQLVIGSLYDGGGQTLPMTITAWDENEIEANLPRTPGLTDQSATLVVTTASGQQMTFPVQFYQNRVQAVFNVTNPIDFVAAARSAQTTYDKYYLLNFKDGTTSPAAEHYIFCCSSVSGIDYWFIKLANGWQIPGTNDAYLVPSIGVANQLSSLFFVQFHNETGFTNCGFFSSGDGYINDMKSLPPPYNAPYSGYQAQVDVHWTAGSNCSGIAYALQLRVYGPDGVPFD